MGLVLYNKVPREANTQEIHKLALCGNQLLYVPSCTSKVHFFVLAPEKTL